MKPTVGLVYWYPRARVDGLHFYKHEVRAIVDDHFVWRFWALTKKRWFYGVEPLWMFGHGAWCFTRRAADAWARKHWGRL